VNAAVTEPNTQQRSEERKGMGVACGAHALHDGYTDVIYVMLPIWQAEFGLSYAAVGLLRGVFSGAMASFQIPASLLAERLGVPMMLAAGTALVGLGYCLVALSTGYASLVALLFVAGLGASVQHPLASSLVASLFAGARSITALGTYNFAGDVGKMVVPAAAALLIVIMPWRPALALLGALGLIAALAILAFTPRRHEAAASASSEAAAASSAPAAPWGFPVLLSIGVIDSATRMGFLTFMPFLLAAKGASVPMIGFALTLTFVGGAVGKLVCAFIGARIGVLATVWLTEGATAIAIIALLPLPLEAGLVLLPLIGIALNGTSSVLYGSVPLFAPAERRARAFSIFYTGTIGSGAVAPILYGFVGDALGVPATLAVVAAIVLTTLPLAFVLRGPLARAA
jgi:MFS transporter, FSR family, fosmidomycin resistance protein